MDIMLKDMIIVNYQVCYVIDGKGPVSINDKNFEMSKGDIFIFNPFEYHSLKSDKNILLKQ